MSVLVTTARRARAGQEEQVVTAARRWFASQSEAGTPRREARLFQSLGDPADFLYLARWASTSAFEAFISQVGTPDAERLFEAPATFDFWNELTSYDNMGRRTNVGGCAIVEASAEQAELVRTDLLRRLSEIRGGHPELVTHALAQDQTRPGRFLILYGWSSHAALERFSHDEAPLLVERLAAEFGATYRAFVGIVRATYRSDASR